jgi:hypothetical protein
MSQRTKQRAVALVALFAILFFAYGAANHFHSTSAAQDHCQVCHVAHSLSLNVSCAALFLAPSAIARLVLASRPNPHFEALYGHVPSRAPPASLQLFS